FGRQVGQGMHADDASGAGCVRRAVTPPTAAPGQDQFEYCVCSSGFQGGVEPLPDGLEITGYAKYPCPVRQACQVFAPEQQPVPVNPDGFEQAVAVGQAPVVGRNAFACLPVDQHQTLRNTSEPLVPPKPKE